MRLKSGNESVEFVLNTATKILDENSLLTLSTYSDDEIWTSTVFYSFDKHFNFYFVSDPDSMHCKMIAKNNKVAFAIYSTNTIWGTDIQGLQFQGTAERMPIHKILSCGAHYLMRFPVAQKFIESPEILLSDKTSVRLYSIRPTSMQVYDEITFTEGEPYRWIDF